MVSIFAQIPPGFAFETMPPPSRGRVENRLIEYGAGATMLIRSGLAQR